MNQNSCNCRKKVKVDNFLLWIVKSLPIVFNAQEWVEDYVSGKTINAQVFWTLKSIGFGLKAISSVLIIWICAPPRLRMRLSLSLSWILKEQRRQKILLRNIISAHSSFSWIEILLGKSTFTDIFPWLILRPWHWSSIHQFRLITMTNILENEALSIETTV